MTPKITHRPKGSMCLNCKYCVINGNDFNEIDCPASDEFKSMQPISKDDDGTIVVKCMAFERIQQ